MLNGKAKHCETSVTSFKFELLKEANVDIHIKRGF